MLSKNTVNNLIIVVILLLCALFAIITLRKDSTSESSNPSSYSYTTTSGKKILIEEQDTEKEKSVIQITTEGFEQNTPIRLEKDTLTNVYFADLNGDSYEEVVLVFASQTEPRYGEAVTYTTYFENSLTPVEVPVIEEADKASGELFEGYLGGDIFVVEKNMLFRTFLVERGEEEVDTASEVIEEETATEEAVVEENTQEDIQEGELQQDENQEVVSDENEQVTKEQVARKQIVYSLLFAEGEFYLEPSEIETVKQLTASTTATLPNTSWKWLSLSYDDRIVSSAQNDDIAILFNEDSTFSATSSCGIFGGGYVSSNNILRVGSIATKEKKEGSICSSGIEEFKNIFPLSESFVIRDNQLMINLEGRKGVILFIRQ